MNLAEVLNDPQFVEFLKKWEMNRRPSAVRAIFESNPQTLFLCFNFNFIIFSHKTNFYLFFFPFSWF